MDRKAVSYGSLIFFIAGVALAPFAKSGILVMGAIGLMVLLLPVATIAGSTILYFMKRSAGRFLLLGIALWLLFAAGLVIGLFCHNKYITATVLDAWDNGQTSFTLLPYGEFQQVVPPPAGTLAQYYSTNCWYYFTIIETAHGPALEYRD